MAASCSTALFEYDCEAVRVRVKRLCKNGQEEQRTFSIDPNLTSYDILKSILSRAYDIVDDFVIYFSSSSTGRGEDWLPLLSDWDLDVAILSAADPFLLLMITERKLKTLDLPPSPSDGSLSGLTAVTSGGMDSKLVTAGGAAKTSIVSPAAASVGGNHTAANSNQFSAGGASVFNSFRQHVEKSLPSLTNRLQKAFTVAEDTILPKGQQVISMLESTCQDGEQLPMTEKEFRTNFLNKVGEVIKPREMRLSVYQAGAEPQLRKVLWKHLLGVYPPGLTGKERVDYIKVKVGEYEQLKQTWMGLILQGRVTDDLKYITNMVKKDVLRTDRHLAFYSGEGNPNVTVLYNILTTFALNHPTVGYCQGMSDLLSPLLFVMNDEGHAYVSFCALMSRLKSNFYPDGKAMTKKFEHLSQGLLFYDPEFYAYLKLRHADDLLYCYRWLLLEMKREFSFEDSCSALEVLWSSLPPAMQTENNTGVKLYEHRFRSKKPPKIAYPVPYSSSSSSNGDKPGPAIPGCSKRETVFTSVVSLRKRLTSLEAEMASPGSGSSSDSSNQSRARIQSASSAEEKQTAKEKKQNRRRNQLTKSKSLLSRNGSSESGSSVPGGPSGTPEETNTSKKVNDLNDFYKLSPSSSTGVGVKKVVPPVGTPSSVHMATVSNNKGSEDLTGEVLLSESDPDDEDGLSESEGINYSMCKELNLPFNRLPAPTQFGDGNPFLMFMCIACILQHRNYIMEQQLDYQEIAMFFDRMVRRHDVKKTLRLARKMFAEYLNDDWKRDLNSSPSDAFKPC